MANPEAVKVFKQLAEQFEIDPKVTSWLTAPDGLAAKNLDDLLYACNEDGIDKLVEAAKPTNIMLSTSRLRQAWRSLKKARDEDDVIKRAGQDTMDMDELLQASVLDDIEARHWARYKMTWPPEIAPADTLVSRVVRELEKRTLSVQMVLKVRTQAHQQRDVRKRTRVAEGLEMVSAAAERDAAPSLHNYLANLMTLLVAYSKAGCKLRADAPTAEPKTVDSTSVVECPLDVLMRYYFRVQDRAHALQYQMALGWIQRKDEAERTVWVDRFRNSTESLGEIIQHTLQTREAMWEVPPPRSGSQRRRVVLCLIASARFPLVLGPKPSQGGRRPESAQMRCPTEPSCAAVSTRGSAVKPVASATLRIDAASSSRTAVFAVGSTPQSTTGETPRSCRNRPQEAGDHRRAMRVATCLEGHRECATHHGRALQTPMRRQVSSVGVKPANSREETGYRGLVTPATTCLTRHRKFATHHGRSLQTPVRRQAPWVGVRPANSREETGNWSQPANSREETGLLTLWMSSQARMHQLRTHWHGADGVWNQ